jgi:hypothetical protein
VKGKIQALDDGDLKPDQIKEIATRSTSPRKKSCR